MTKLSVGRRLRAVTALSFALALVPAFAGLTTAAGKADVATVRQVTQRFHDVNAAIAAGYVPFYTCTEQPGVGTMGQHYVKLSLVGDRRSIRSIPRPSSTRRRATAGSASWRSST
jgi:hypothetical protein